MEPGTIIGEYRVDRLLGEGGMAAVYQVWNSGLQRNEALKLLTPHLAHDRAFVERFLQEARTAANLQHPHIATIFAVSPSDAPQPFFTMQLLPGGDLADLLAQQGKLGVSQALPLLEEMADALDYAHSQGVVHRDIKPANILLQTDAARKLHVKLVDFGIARAQESGKTRLTKAGMLMGTPEYMAPEQAGTTDPISGCTDQYALGIVAYEMFCGRPPFPHRPDTSPISVIMSHCNTPPPPPVSLTPELPAEVSAALLRALSKRPQERFGSCGEFVRALKGQAHSVALAVPASYASTPAPASVPAAPARSAPVSWMPIAAITLAAVLGIGLVLNRLNKTQEPNREREGQEARASGNGNVKPPFDPGSDSKSIKNGLNEEVASGEEQAIHDGAGHSAPSPLSLPISRFVRADELSFSASSSKKDNIGVHLPQLVMDGKEDTAWEEASSGDGNGEWIQFEFKDSRQHTIRNISIIDGYKKYGIDKTGDRWTANNRARQVEVALDDQPTYLRNLSPEDRSFQNISPLVPSAARRIRLTFHDIVKGRRSNDLCISEARIEIQE